MKAQISKLKTQNLTTDWHCHILPGIDDGARSADEAVAMARSLAQGGFGRVCCTPHCIRGAYDTSPEMVRDAIADLQPLLKREGVELQLDPGMEYYLDELFLREKELLPLGDSRMVLVEAPSQAHPGIVLAGLRHVVDSDCIPLVAHPERSTVFSSGEIDALLKAEEPDIFESIRYQANLGSFAGLYGSRVQQRAYGFLRQGRYGFLGSDGHVPQRLAGMLRSWRQKCQTNPALRLLAGMEDGVGGDGHFTRAALAGAR